MPILDHTPTPEDIEHTMMAMNLSDHDWDRLDRRIRHALVTHECVYPALVAALQETLDALYNETYGIDKEDSPWIHAVKERANAALALARKEGV